MRCRCRYCTAVGPLTQGLVRLLVAFRLHGAPLDVRRLFAQEMDDGPTGVGETW